MINKKLAGVLILPVMLGVTNASQAATNIAQQLLQSTLGTYIDIQPITSGALTTTTIAPAAGILDAQLNSKFKITLNANAQKLYLQDATGSQSGNVNALFQQGGFVYAVFSNTASGNLPTTVAIANAKTITPIAANNANAIVYAIGRSLSNGVTSTYDPAKNQYNITANMGITDASVPTALVPYTNTYSFSDTAGTYQATITLTSAGL